jgi:hypothetical protein
VLVAAIVVRLGSSHGPCPGCADFSDGTLTYLDTSYGAATGTSTVELINGSKLPADTGFPLARHQQSATALDQPFRQRLGAGRGQCRMGDFSTAPLDSIVWSPTRRWRSPRANCP